jgi:hypothetical protein
MFQLKVVRKTKIHVVCATTFFFLENRAVDEVMWKNIVELGRWQCGAYALHSAN